MTASSKPAALATLVAAVVGAAAASAVDRCPMGGIHDPADSDRPCPRCGASPR